MRTSVVFVGLGLVALSLSGCSSDSDSTAYKGFGKMVAERNEARKSAAEEQHEEFPGNWDSVVD